jgi:shikimate 5-dehydrogenase
VTARALADSFPKMEFTICEALEEVGAADLVVGCIPADDVREGDIPLQMFMEEGGCVVEMSYRPPVSALMSMARRRPGWTVFGGVDVLKEQAYAQSEIWTGRPAPVEVIQKALAERQKL